MTNGETQVGPPSKRSWNIPGVSAHGTNELMVFVVVVVLTIAYAFRFVFPRAGVDAVDPQMFKEVLIFVLGSAFGAQAMGRGVEKGSTALLTPPPTAPPGTTVTTTTPPAPGTVTTTVTPEVKP